MPKRHAVWNGDEAAKWMLGIAGVLSPASLILAAPIWIKGIFTSWGFGLLFAAGGIWCFGHIVGGCLFLTGLLIQARRGRWHVGWTTWYAIYTVGWISLFWPASFSSFGKRLLDPIGL